MDQSNPTTEMATTAIAPPLEQNTGMTRGEQTAIIVAVILAVALVFLYVATRRSANDPYKECEGIFGVDIAGACAAGIARQRLGGSRYID